MYVITDRGRAALRNRDKYSHDQAQEFAELIEEEVNELASSEGSNG